MSEENERLRQELEYWSKLISAHKKSRAIQETTSKVHTNSPSQAAASDDCSNSTTEDCFNSVCSASQFTLRDVSSADTSLLPGFESFALSDCDGHSKKILKNLEKVPANLADTVTNGGSEADTSSNLSCVGAVQIDKVSGTQSETCGQRKHFKMPDLSSALAADMLNLYRSKVLPKNDPCTLVSSNYCQSSATANNGVDRHKISRNVAGVQMPSSSMIQLKKMVVSKPFAVSKSPFKLVHAKTVPPWAHRVSVPVSNYLQTAAHFDRNALTSTSIGKQPATVTCSSNLMDGISCCTSVSTSRTVSYLSSRPNNVSLQITVPVSSSISSPNKFATSSNFTYQQNAKPSVIFASSKYKLIRKGDQTCKQTTHCTSVTRLKNANVSAYSPSRALKHVPSVLVTNKYKLVRNKRRSLTLLGKRTLSDMKKPAAAMAMTHDVLSPSRRNSSKLKSSRYKLVRKNEEPCSVPVKKPSPLSVSNQTLSFCRSASTVGSKTVPSKFKLVRKNYQPHSIRLRKNRLASNHCLTGDKVQVLSKYKLVRRKCATSRTPQGVTLTPTNTPHRVAPYARNGYSKHVTPPLFLNKYKLIRKRALLKTNFSCSKNSALGSSMIHSRRLASGYSRKQHALTAASSPFRSPPKKRGTRKRSFSSKYALQRSCKGGEAELDINRILGHKVKNLSKSKYKFVSSSAGSRRHSSCRTPLPRKSQLKIDRRSSSARRASQNRRRVLMQAGFSVYKLRRKSGTPVVNRRLSFRASLPSTQRKFNWMRWSSVSQKKRLTAETKDYCMYYNRFGRCSRGDKCKYIHDPDKVSVCTRFLRGTCKVTGCPFSHSVAPHKMPTCRYFLQGVCNRDNCPYRHVNVAHDAEICIDFARGCCLLADSCKKKHLTVCPEFTDTGLCPRGGNCPLRHVKKCRPLCTSTPATTEHTAVGVLAKKTRTTNSDDGDDIMLPLRQRRLPSFIAIDATTPTPKPSSDTVTELNDGETLVIRPRLAPLSTSHDFSWLLDP